MKEVCGDVELSVVSARSLRMELSRFSSISLGMELRVFLARSLSVVSNAFSAHYVDICVVFSVFRLFYECGVK